LIPNSPILLDSGGQQWQLSVTDDGVLFFQAVSGQVLSPAYLVDQVSGTTYQLGVTTSGMATLTAVAATYDRTQQFLLESSSGVFYRVRIYSVFLTTQKIGPARFPRIPPRPTGDAQIVPLNSDPNQSLLVPLGIDGGTMQLSMFLHYNQVAQYWLGSLVDSSGNLLLDSLPLVTGNAPAGNLLKQFAWLSIGSATVISVSGDPTKQVPDDTDLGTDFLLLWSDTPGYGSVPAVPQSISAETTGSAGGSGSPLRPIGPAFPINFRV